eukprot:4262289-Alexandrium_andersonii.AAC.1
MSREPTGLLSMLPSKGAESRPPELKVSACSRHAISRYPSTLPLTVMPPSGGSGRSFRAACPEGHGGDSRMGTFGPESTLLSLPGGGCHQGHQGQGACHSGNGPAGLSYHLREVG